MAFSSWLDRVAIPEAQIHVIPAESGARKAAELYAEVVAKVECFDLVLLGMGEDGHTASLFPGHAEVQSVTESVAVLQAPKPPSERVSLGISALQKTRSQLILVTGSGKKTAMSAWQSGNDLPIVRASLPSACLMLDQAADPDSP
jgi:6-phosphogluconolactonase